MNKTQIRDRRRRRILFIDKKFQTNFIINFCLLVVIGGLITTALLYFFTTRSHTVSFVNSRAVVQTTADFLLPLLAQTVCIVMVIIGLAAIIMTLLVSHRIAGPLYRLKKVLNMLGEGDFSGDFRIRHKDQLQDLASIFNDMRVKIRGRLKMLEKSIRDIKDKASNISEEDIAEHKRMVLKELKNIFGELEKQARYFKL